MMKAAFPEAMVEDITPHLASVPSEVDGADHHVVAAALAGRADAVVTNNLTHFPADQLASLGLDVQSLDDFLLNQLTLDPATVVDVLVEMEADRERPPNTVEELLAALKPHAPSFAEAVGAQGSADWR